MKLLELHEITEMLNDVVEAIHQILNIDVTIIDSEFNRIAGTGRYACDVGGKVASGTVFSEAMLTKRSFIVDQPGKSHVCMSCDSKGQCSETAQVSTPILLEDEVVGVIGLIAFDLEQRERILTQRSQLVGFLENMAKLIALKVKEVQQGKELQILTDVIEDMLISIDHRGKIIRANKRAILLDERMDPSQGQLIGAVFGEALLRKIRSGERQFQWQLSRNDSSFAYDVKVQTVDFNGLDLHYVLSLKPVKAVIQAMNRWLQDSTPTGFGQILGRHPLLMGAMDIAKKTALSTSSILVQGESGTGKELFARAIHQGSLRHKEVFLPINCAAIPEPLLESELFGYEEGTFTGAVKGGRIGKFEQAHKGTLFLDEIGDLPLHLQAKLLRVLQDGSFFRVGGKSEIRVDVRLIAATNRDLERMVRDGEFREDLYYRINVIPVMIPPLRDRISDLDILVDAFIKKYNEKLNREIAGISQEAQSALRAYRWPGNVRELENAIEYSVNFAGDQMIQINDLPRKLREVQLGASGSFETLAAVETRMIKEAVHYYGLSKSGVESICSVLGLSRATFYRKLKQLDSQNET